MTALDKEHSVHVIGDLISTDLHAAATDPISQVAALWEKNPGIDGMAVLEGDRPLYLSRARFFVKLGKRFGYSLFENRPVALLAEEGSTVEADMDPTEVISIATQREADRIYDDIMVLENRRFRGLVSMRSLLVHHKTLLANGIAERSLLEERNRRLEGLQQLQSQFVGALAQEVRGPAGTLLGLARSLLDDSTPDEARRRTVRGLVRCAHDTLSIVDDLQDLLRLELGTLVPIREPTNLRLVVDLVAAQLEPLLTEKGVTLEVVSSGQPPEIGTDPVLLRRILGNLLIASLDRASHRLLILRATSSASAAEIVVGGLDASFSEDELNLLRSRTSSIAARPRNRRILRLMALKGLVAALGGSLEGATEGSESSLRLRIPGL